MAKVSRLPIQDFAGWINNIDPTDAPPGVGIVQRNFRSEIAGEGGPRRGYRLVRFQNETLESINAIPEE